MTNKELGLLMLENKLENQKENLKLLKEKKSKLEDQILQLERKIRKTEDTISNYGRTRIAENKVLKQEVPKVETTAGFTSHFN